MLLKAQHIKMIGYPVQPRDQIFVKSYEFLCFAKDMSKSVGKVKVRI